MVAPDLPGTGGDGLALGAITLDQWAGFVVNHCRAAEGPVILCGHSRGGIVISQAAEQAPEAMSALVYICAMLLPNGMSREDMRATAEPNPAFAAIRSNIDNGTCIDRAGAPAVFAQLSPPDLAHAAAARLVAEPAAPMATRLGLSEARYGSVPRHYVECLQDRAIPIGDQRRMQVLQPCATVIALDADHSPFLSAPRQLAGALVTIAEGVSR